MHVCNLVWLFTALWTVVCQTPLSMGFSRQEYWSGLPFPSPGDLPDAGRLNLLFLCLQFLANKVFQWEEWSNKLQVQPSQEMRSIWYYNCGSQWKLFCSQGIFGNVWRHFWLLHLGGRVWYLVGGGEGCCWTFYHILDAPTAKTCCCWVASVMSDSVRPHRWQPTRVPHPWDSPGKNTGVGCHFLLQCMKVKSESEVTHSCLTFRDTMDCSLPGSSAHEIFQARVLECGARLIWPQMSVRLRLRNSKNMKSV